MRIWQNVLANGDIQGIDLQLSVTCMAEELYLFRNSTSSERSDCNQ